VAIADCVLTVAQTDASDFYNIDYYYYYFFNLGADIIIMIIIIIIPFSVLTLLSGRQEANVACSEMFNI